MEDKTKGTRSRGKKKRREGVPNRMEEGWKEERKERRDGWLKRRHQ